MSAVNSILFYFSDYVQNTIVEASVQLPPSLFSSVLSSGQADDGIYKLQLLAFRNGKLFPPTGNSTKRRSVVTPVILTKIGKLDHLKPTSLSAQLLIVVKWDVCIFMSSGCRVRKIINLKSSLPAKSKLQLSALSHV